MNKIKIYIELPETENGLADIDDIGWTHMLGQKVREAVPSAIKDYLVEKYADKFELEFDVEEMRPAIRERIIGRLADKALERED